MPADPHAAKVAEFLKQIDFQRPWMKTYLGDPPMLDGRNLCTFCGKGFPAHSDGRTAVFSYNVSRTLREYHRFDFGGHGYYEDERTD